LIIESLKATRNFAILGNKQNFADLKRSIFALNRLFECWGQGVYPCELLVTFVSTQKLLRGWHKAIIKIVLYYCKYEHIDQLDKTAIIEGQREVNTWPYEIKLFIRTIGVRYAPKFIVNVVRNYMIKRGHHYFSQDA